MRWTIWSKRVSNSVMCRFLFYVRRLSFVDFIAGAMVGSSVFHKTLKASIEDKELGWVMARSNGFQILWAKMFPIDVSLKADALPALGTNDGDIIGARPRHRESL